MDTTYICAVRGVWACLVCNICYGHMLHIIVWLGMFVCVLSDMYIYIYVYIYIDCHLQVCMHKCMFT